MENNNNIDPAGKKSSNGVLILVIVLVVLFMLIPLLIIGFVIFFVIRPLTQAGINSINEYVEGHNTGVSYSQSLQRIYASAMAGDVIDTSDCRNFEYFLADEDILATGFDGRGIVLKARGEQTGVEIVFNGNFSKYYKLTEYRSDRIEGDFSKYRLSSGSMPSIDDDTEPDAETNADTEETQGEQI